MFDIDSGKLLILALIALIVIKPKDLPGVMRQVGQAVGQLRRMAAEFQGQFKDALREAELDELKKDVAKVADLDGLDPFMDVKKDIEQTRTEIESELSKPVVENTFAESIEQIPAPAAHEAAVANDAPAAVHTAETPPAPEAGRSTAST